MLHARRRALAVAAATSVVAAGGLWGAGAASAAETPRPDTFTSAYTVDASSEAVFDRSGSWVAGEEGASGVFDIQINSDLDVICWEMSLTGVEGEYDDAAASGVTLRESPASWNGPARIAVPEPVQDGDRRTGSGCAQGPFTSGVQDETGEDTGAGFRLADIEADPASYAVDVRTAAFPDGAVRGQLTQVPVGGLDTGFGGLQRADDAATTAVALLAVGVAAVAGTVGMRRARASS